MLMIFYTYIWKNPLKNNEPFYVGKGKDDRAYVMKEKNQHFTNTVNRIKKAGLEPIIEFLCKDVDEELAFLVEVEAIAKYGRRDLKTGCLTNQTNGGEGTAGHIGSWRGKKQSAEHCANKNAALRGFKHSDESRALIKSKRALQVTSAETCNKISSSLTGRTLSESHYMKKLAAYAELSCIGCHRVLKWCGATSVHLKGCV
jgi:hypothetical protein